MQRKSSKQKVALSYFIKHQKELCKRFFGKELLLSGRKIIAAFDSLGEAVETGEQKFGAGNYSVYKCLPGESAYSINVPLFHAYK
jgi:hypothetical protein